MADAPFPAPMRKTGYPTRREMARLVRSGVVASAVAGALLSCGPEQGTSPGDAGKEEKADVPHTEEAWVTPGLVIDTVSTDRWENRIWKPRCKRKIFMFPTGKGRTPGTRKSSRSRALQGYPFRRWTLPRSKVQRGRRVEPPYLSTRGWRPRRRRRPGEWMNYLFS